MPFKSILHPTDFSNESRVAFNHALKLAIEYKSKLVLMYVSPESNTVLEWEKFPKVRDTLSKWNLIKKNAKREDIFNELGVEVKEVIGKGDNLVNSVTGIIPNEEIDLIVMSTHGRDGLSKFINPSIAEPISRKARIPTLFIPYNSKQFVSNEDGKINLNKILIPIDRKPKPDIALNYGVNISNMLRSSEIRFHILHILDKEDPWSDKEISKIIPPQDEKSVLNLKLNTKSISFEVIKFADEVEADLMIVVTEGHKGFLDILRGSTSEQILRKSKYPILTIPSDYQKPLLSSEEN